MKTENTTATGIATTPWRHTSAPNGCVRCEERTVTSFTIFEADYYNTGMHRYVRGHHRIEIRMDGTTVIGPAFGQFSDGSAESVDKWLARADKNTG